MLPYFHSASRAIRRWFTPTRRRPIRNARARTPLHLESLEDRTLPSASVSATVANNVLSIVLTDAAADTTTVSIHRKSSDSTNDDYKNLEIVLGGTAQSTTYDLTSLTSIQLQAGAGTDTLTVDQGNGDLNVPVTFLAGTGSDTYSDTGASMSGVLSSHNKVLSIVLTDAAADTTTLSIHRKSSDNTSADYNNLEITLNGTAQSTTYDLTSLTGIQLQAGDGTDTLTVDQGNGDLSLPVTFLAGTGSDTYSDTDADLSGVQSNGDFVLGDQLNTSLSNLQTLIDDNVYNQPLPVVATTGSTTGSNKLQDVGQADIIGTFSATLQNALDNTSDTNPNGLASTAGPADIQKALYAALGPSGANLLQDKPGDTDKKTDINDVVVVANNGTFSYQMSLANQNHAYDTATLLDFDPGLAGLPLTLSDQSQQKVQTEFGYKYDLKFDIANSAAASIDNSTTSSQPLLIDLNARLNSGYEDKNATFGLLSADITDSTSFPTTLNAQYHVTFSGSGNSSAASAKVDGVAFIDPHMVLSVMPNQLGPDSLTGGPNSTGDTINLKFFADMTTTWHFGTSTAPVALGPLTAFGSKPTVSFAMSMDPNSFFLNFVRTIVKDDILPEFKSIQSLVDALDYKVPGLGIGLDDLLDNAVLGTTQALTAVGNFRGFFESIHKFQLLAQDLASFPAFTVFPLQLVDLGSFSISQDARTKNSNTSTDTRTNAFVTIQPSDVTPPPATDPYTLLPKGDPLTQLRRLANDIGHLIDDLNPVDDPFGKQFQVGFPVNFFDMIQESVTYGLGGGQPDSFKTVTFDLLQFPMLDSPAGGSDHTAINIFNMLMGHHESLLTWTTPPVILNVNGTYRISPPTLNGGFDLRLVPNIQFLAHFAGGFDTHGLESADPNQGYYLTRADPAESDRSDITTLVDQVTNDPNTLQSTFMSLTVSIGLDPGFQLSNILANTGLGNVLDALGVDVTFTLGLTFGGDIVWKPDDPDAAALTDGLKTAFVDPSTITPQQFEQQVMRPSELLSELQDCGSIWETTGDLFFGFNFFLDITIFYIPIISQDFNIVSFKIADFNSPPCNAPPPLAHLGDPNNNVSGPYAAAQASPSKEVAGTLYLNTATAQPADSTDTSQDDTIVITALANNADGTDNLLVSSQGRTQEFDNVHAIYADGGGGKDSFIVKAGVRVPAEIHDGDGNDHLEYDGSGSASLHAGDGTNTLIGGMGNNTLVSGNGNSHLQATGPGSLTAGNGDNTIVGGSGTQTITVGNGNNSIQFGSGNSTITLGTGANTVSGKIKGGHVTISDPSSTDTDHTGNGLGDRLILNGTPSPDNVSFSAGTLNGSPAVQIDDGTASSTWSVTVRNIKNITFQGGGNSSAIGRNGDNITVGDLSSTGVATVNVNPNLGQTPNRQKDAFTVLGTTHADSITIDASTSKGGVSGGVAVTGLGYTVNFAGMEPAYDTLTVNGNGGDDTFTVGNGGFTATTTTGTTTYPRAENSFKSLTVQAAAGSSSQVIVNDDADFTLSDTALTRSTGGTITLNNIAKAKLTGGASVNHFHVLNWTGTANLDGVGNSDAYQVDFKGAGSGVVNVTDTGSGPPASNLDTLTVNGTAGSDTILIDSAHVARGTEQVNYSGVESVTVNGAPNLTGTAADTFNVTSTSVPTTVNTAAVSAGAPSNANVVNVGSKAPAAGGIVDNIQGPLVVVGSGPDTMNVDDTGSTAPKTGTLTPTTLTGLNMGTGGITYSGLATLNIQLGSGGSTIPNSPVGNTFTINDINPLTHTSVDGGVSNNDTVNATFAADFNGRLDLTAFEHGSVNVNGNWNGTLTDTQPGHLETVNIVNGAMTPTGVLQVGSLDTMTIGPAHLSVGQDMAGQIVVSGTLGSLRVAGGTPGSITAGHIGTVSVYGGFGPVVLQITENGIQRRVEEATPANPYPLPNPNVTAATSPYATVNAPGTPSYINIQYIYESGALANPQWTARITNGVSTAADQYDLSLVTYNDTAKFNLARLDAAGISGIRNVAVEGDVLTAVSSQALGFFPGDNTPAGIRLPQDNLAGVGVRDNIHNSSIQAASIRAVAFGSYTNSTTKVTKTGAASLGSDAQALLVTGTAMVYSNDTFRAPFADLSSQQVQMFLVTNPLGGSFDNNGIRLTVQSVTSPNATGKANIVTQSNVARGAATALVKVVPTYDSQNNLLNPVVQSIDLRGDGGSIQTQQPFSATSSITSTGPLGDLTVLSAQGINNVTAPSIFGSISTPGLITGLVQTTGQRINPITSVVTTVPADFGRLYVNTSGKSPVVTSSTVQAGGLSGKLVSRGDLISQVTLSGTVLTGVIAAQGNLGKIFTPSSGPATRLGGVLVNNPFDGQLVTLGTSYGDLRFNGGLKAGRIAVKGGIAGNLVTNGIAANGAVVSGGEIGDTTWGTLFTVNGTNKGFIAAKGPVRFKAAPGGNVFTNATGSNAATIDAIFTKNGQALSSFDASGLDLANLNLILADLASLHVDNTGHLAGPMA